MAVLTPSAEMSACGVYHGGLEKSDLFRGCAAWRTRTPSFAPGAEVTEIEQAKGLEFDYVVLSSTSPRSTTQTHPEARRRLHVGATRAVHQLWLTSAVGTPSPLLAGLEE